VRQIFPIVAVVTLALTLATGCGEDADSSEQTPSTSALRMGQGIPALIDLGSNSCIPCQMMEGELRRLDQETGDLLVVEIIDVYRDRNAAQTFGVRVIPTQIFLDEGGVEIHRNEGYMSYDDMIQRWHILGYSFEQESQQ
jgi:thioredoxin 1